MFRVKLLLFAIRAIFCSNREEAAKQWKYDKKYFALTPHFCSFTWQTTLTCSRVFSWKRNDVVISELFHCIRLSLQSCQTDQQTSPSDRNIRKVETKTKKLIKTDFSQHFSSGLTSAGGKSKSGNIHTIWLLGGERKIQENWVNYWWM